MSVYRAVSRLLPAGRLVTSYRPLVTSCRHMKDLNLHQPTPAGRLVTSYRPLVTSCRHMKDLNLHQPTPAGRLVTSYRRLVTSCGHMKDLNLHQPTPAGPLGTWATLKPRPELQVDTDAAPDPAETSPLRHPDYFGVRDLFTVSDLFDARVHLGHVDGSLNPYMAEFVLGSRLGVCVFDLDRTAQLLRDALNFTAHIAYRGGIIMFVCRSPQHIHLVERTAMECGEFSHCRHWPQGVFTDSTAVFGGVTRLPDLLVMLSTLDTVLDQHVAVQHAAKLLIPTVGVVDSNCDPRLVTYPVPGNDDSGAAVRLYCRLFSEAVRRGKATREKDGAEL